MGIALAEPTLVRQVEQWGQKTDRPVEKILELAVQTYLDELEKEAIRSETQAFWTIHDELLKTYPEEYIALVQGKVVDHDKDVSRLEERIRKQFGLLPVLIAAVKPEPRRDLHWRGGRIDQMATNE
jgi:hypothetical protein